MKKYLLITLVAIFSSICCIGLLKINTKKETKDICDTIVTEDINKSENINKETMNNLLKHIGYAEEAISKFEVNEPKEAIDLWAEGIISGNGVLQYAVMDKNLQKEFKVYLQRKNNISWNTSIEEQNVQEYEIIDYTEVSEKIKIYNVRFYYINSQGIKCELDNKVTVVDEGGRWMLSSIR